MIFCEPTCYELVQDTDNKRLIEHAFFVCTGLNIHQVGEGQSSIDLPILEEGSSGRFLQAFQFDLRWSNRLIPE